MKRDMDLAREILIKIEDNPNAIGYWLIDDLRIEGRSQEEVSYHIKLLCQAGLIDASDESDNKGFEWLPKCLTWQGHEFLDTIRKEGLWQKAKKTVTEKTGGLSFEVLKRVLIEQALEAMKNIGG